MERVVMMEGVMGGTLEIITHPFQKTLKGGFTMMDKKVFFKLLLSEVNLNELTFKPLHPYMKNQVLIFLTHEHLFNFLNKLFSYASNLTEEVVLWNWDGLFVVDFPDLEGKLFFNGIYDFKYIDTIEKLLSDNNFKITINY
ncbi:MAG: hypothetical protein QXX12_04930 [Nanopusillaceae archaeon]